MNNYRYSLDRSSRKFKCPACGNKRFVKYVDNDLKTYLHESVGRCDREQSCGYYLSPRHFFERTSSQAKEIRQKIRPKSFKLNKSFNVLSSDLVKRSMTRYEKNCFVQYLHTLFESDIVEQLIEIYSIGTSTRWQGATAFFQKDTENRIRQVKVMLYNSVTGRRIKKEESPYRGQAKIYFAGKQILRDSGTQNPNLKQCFFGEHLLRQDNHIVAIVESEKTAIILHGYALTGLAPKYTWLATGGKNGCRWYGEAAQVLKDRDVILFPDLGAFQEWTSRSKELTCCYHVVSDMLEKIATKEERTDGLDLADYYTRLKQE